MNDPLDPKRLEGLVHLVPGETTLEAAERKLILATLEALDGNIKNSAKALGISRSAIYAKMKRLEIHVEDGDVTDLRENRPAPPPPQAAPPTKPPEAAS